MSTITIVIEQSKKATSLKEHVNITKMYHKSSQNRRLRGLYGSKYKIQF